VTRTEGGTRSAVAVAEARFDDAFGSARYREILGVPLDGVDLRAERVFNRRDDAFFGPATGPNPPVVKLGTRTSLATDSNLVAEVRSQNRTLAFHPGI
jgi:hypothetical protein